MVISNSSPLIHLSIIGRLNLLEKKFSEIMIPPAVWREVVIDGFGKPGAKKVEQAKWIKVQDVNDRNLVISLGRYLDAGESEAIALALEIGASLVLLDERDARDTADAFGLNILGVIGILVWARKKQLIPTLKDELAHLQEIAKFRFSEELYRKALVEVGEMK